VRPPAARDTGFTLVELMIAIVAASLIAAGTFTFFAGQQRIYEMQTKMLGVQENLWAALETVTRYVRSSGAGMNDCVRGDADGAGPDTGDPPPAGNAAPATGLRAFLSGQGAFRIAPLWIRNGPEGTPDTITVAYGRGATGNFRDAFLGASVLAGNATGNFTTLLAQSRRFLSGEFVLLVHEARADGDRGCSLFRITDISAGDVIAHTVVSPWNADANLIDVVPFDYPGGSASSTGGLRNFGELVWVRLAIDATGAPDVAPRLTLDRLDDADPPQVLAEGIEDMQVAYGCDISGGADGTITEGTDALSRQSDEWIYNQTGDIEPVNCRRPDAVRITLIGRTATPDSLLTESGGNVRPSAEDGATAVADMFRHRAVSATIRLRN
jgi:prepilin-type N-terminal cleavage/methylation domain-containing protein